MRTLRATAVAGHQTRRPLTRSRFESLDTDPALRVVCALNPVGDAELARVAREIASSLAGQVKFVHGLAAVTESLDASLIVVGNETGSSRLAATAHCPVLIVPSQVQRHVHPRDWRSRTLVCGFDGSAAAWAAAMYAATLAAALHGSITLVSIGPAVTWRMSDVAGTLRAKLIESGAFDERFPMPRIHCRLCDGDPAGELERVAASTAAPLIAIGSAGSVTRRLLDSSRRPVVVTPA